MLCCCGPLVAFLQMAAHIVLLHFLHADPGHQLWLDDQYFVHIFFFCSNWKQPHLQMHIHVEQHWHQAPLLSGKKRVSQIIQYKDYSKLHIVSVTNIRDTRSPLPFQCSCPCALAFKSVSLEDMVSRYQTAVAPIIQGNGYHCPEWSCSECLLDGWHCLQWPRPRLQSPVVLWRVVFCH